jgi:hypothetical protein
VSGRAYLERLGEELVAARRLRHEPDALFDDVDDDDLERASRALRAIGYSATTGARKLEGIVRSRHGGRPATEVPEVFEALRAGEAIDLEERQPGTPAGEVTG